MRIMDGSLFKMDYKTDTVKKFSIAMRSLGLFGIEYSDRPFIVPKTDIIKFPNVKIEEQEVERSSEQIEKEAKEAKEVKEKQQTRFIDF